MEDTDGGLHHAVDGQSLGERWIFVFGPRYSTYKNNSISASLVPGYSTFHFRPPATLTTILFFKRLFSSNPSLLLGACLIMIVWTRAVLGVLYARVLYFCICTCSTQLSMFHMERRSRNTTIIIIIMLLSSSSSSLSQYTLFFAFTTNLNSPFELDTKEETLTSFSFFRFWLRFLARNSNFLLK